MTEGCVRLGDDDAPDCWSEGVACDTDEIEGVIEGVDGVATAAACAGVCDELPRVLAIGATAAAAAVAYRIGGIVAGGVGLGGCRPALRILAIGC